MLLDVVRCTHHTGLVLGVVGCFDIGCCCCWMLLDDVWMMLDVVGLRSYLGTTSGLVLDVVGYFVVGCCLDDVGWRSYLGTTSDRGLCWMLLDVLSSDVVNDGGRCCCWMLLMMMDVDVVGCCWMMMDAVA